jgi:hypothetical protein
MDGGEVVRRKKVLEICWWMNFWSFSVGELEVEVFVVKIELSLNDSQKTELF